MFFQIRPFVRVEFADLLLFGSRLFLVAYL